MEGRKKSIQFIFEKGLDLFSHHGIGTMMLNLHSIGLSGTHKTDRQEKDVLDLMCGLSYAPLFGVERERTRFNFYYLWTGGKGNVGERTVQRKEMQSNSDWFFNLVQAIEPSVILVKTGNFGKSVPRSGSTLKELEQGLGWYNESSRIDPNSDMIRIRSGSRHHAYEIFPENRQYVYNVLNKLKIKYKIM
jgi:hypothetical protein